MHYFSTGGRSRGFPWIVTGAASFPFPFLAMPSISSQFLFCFIPVPRRLRILSFPLSCNAIDIIAIPIFLYTCPSQAARPVSSTTGQESSRAQIQTLQRVADPLLQALPDYLPNDNRNEELERAAATSSTAFPRLPTPSHAFSRLPTPSSYAFPRPSTPFHAFSRLFTPFHACHVGDH